MKVYIMCYIPAQIPYLGKIRSCDLVRNDLTQSDCRISKSTISLEQTNEIADFLYFDKNYLKSKVDWKNFMWASSETDVASLVTVLQNRLYLNNEWME